MPDTWEALEHDCKNCRECSLWETRTNVVFGVGNQNAEVLFIGEGPGANEDAQGVPFVGRAGHLLDDMLEIIGLKRDDVYIANIVSASSFQLFPGNHSKGKTGRIFVFPSV